MSRRPGVLFLCTGNSCRSQMAEGFARHQHARVIEAFSAGIIAKGLNPLAVKAMSEVGIDISAQCSRALAQVIAARRAALTSAGEPESTPVFDLVVTVCGHAHETCPMFPGRVRVVHVGFDDPPELARHAASEEEAMPHYRRVRDEIARFVQTLPTMLHQA